jgi:molybdate transport system substrate-binding protein
MRWAFSVAAAVMLACRSAPVSPPPVRVAAAADLTQAFEELARGFPEKVEFSFGSSGLLARQVREGAPFDVFAAANVSFVDDAVKAGACDAATKRSYARGRLAVWTREGTAVSVEALGDERFKHLALANPEHAPYGQAAKEALVSAGLWERVEPRVVYAENVRAALQFAQSGNAEVALVAASLVIGADAGAFTLVDESRHKPLEQALVVCAHGPNAKGGRAFADLVASDAGRAVLARYGFSPP